jgi:membrane-bound inhibitor of C-type lysozyme
MTRFAALARSLVLCAGLLGVGLLGVGLLGVGLLGACQTHPEGAPAATAPGPGSAAATEHDVTFACEDASKLRVVFTGGTATATDAHGRTVHLTQQESGSGILYEGEGYGLRGKGEEIDWTTPDGNALACSASTSTLAGSHWQLVEYRAADGKVERPADPSRYVLELVVGGRLAMQLDCNRATGRWTASATGEAGGVIMLNAPAMTRALCPEGSWDNRLAGDLLSARTYSLAGDHLTVTLENHSAYVWRRLPG